MDTLRFTAEIYATQEDGMGKFIGNTYIDGPFQSLKPSEMPVPKISIPDFSPKRRAGNHWSGCTAESDLFKLDSDFEKISALSGLLNKISSQILSSVVRIMDSED